MDVCPPAVLPSVRLDLTTAVADGFLRHTCPPHRPPDRQRRAVAPDRRMLAGGNAGSCQGGGGGVGRGAATPTLLFFPFAPRGLGASGGQAQAWALQPRIPPDVGSSGGPREAALSPSP